MQIIIEHVQSIVTVLLWLEKPVKMDIAMYVIQDYRILNMNRDQIGALTTPINKLLSIMFQTDSSFGLKVKRVFEA